MIFKHQIADQLLKRLDTIDAGMLKLMLPNGKVHYFEGKKEGPSADIAIKDWTVFSNMVSKGDIAFANDYRNGLWETDNLINILNFGLKNDSSMDDYIFGKGFFQFFSKISYLLKENSIRGSKKNIHAHYDLGNSFYKLWLDQSMTYSSALYKNTEETLEQAQNNKYDRILDRLGVASGSLIEIGCGWGGFADRALQKGDYAIKGITISEEQFSYAKNRVEGKANIAFEDYRHQKGKFDHLVSIEMFEAVGEKYWKSYFSKMKELLNPQGNAVIQTITIDDSRFDKYKKSGDFIRSYIFPGGMLPSSSVLQKYIHDAGLRIIDTYTFAQDYARTLKEWLHRFDAQKDIIKSMDFDEGFIRLWRFYLAGCIAGFETGRTDVVQLHITHNS